MPQNCSQSGLHHSLATPFSTFPSSYLKTSFCFHSQDNFPFLPFSRILSWFLPNWQLIKMPCSSLPFSSRLSPTTTIMVRLPIPTVIVSDIMAWSSSQQITHTPLLAWLLYSWSSSSSSSYQQRHHDHHDGCQITSTVCGSDRENVTPTLGSG